jgi:hypothetical protein
MTIGDRYVTAARCYPHGNTRPPNSVAGINNLNFTLASRCPAHLTLCLAVQLITLSVLTLSHRPPHILFTTPRRLPRILLTTPATAPLLISSLCLLPSSASHFAPRRPAHLLYVSTPSCNSSISFACYQLTLFLAVQRISLCISPFSSSTLRLDIQLIPPYVAPSTSPLAHNTRNSTSFTSRQLRTTSSNGQSDTNSTNSRMVCR